jgi:acetyl esterase
VSVSPPPGTLDRRARRLQRVLDVATALRLAPTPEKFLTRPAAKRAGPALPAFLGGKRAVGISVHEDGFDVPGGRVDVRVYGPTGSDEVLPGVVFLHGGGWIGGGLRLYDTFASQLAKRSGTRVVSVAYRLSPESAYPGPLDDCAAALAWTVDNAATLRIDPTAIGIAGDSAGGNLTAALAIRARDEGLPPLRFQGLLYPAVDATMSTDSMASYPGPGLTRADMVVYYGAYAGAADRTLPMLSPLLSPLHVPDATGLAPAVIVTAGFDCLRDEGFLYADKLRAAGVPVQHEHYADAPHGFLSMPGVCSQAEAAITFLADGIRTAVTSERRT